jgi:hypothetical protein
MALKPSTPIRGLPGRLSKIGPANQGAFRTLGTAPAVAAKTQVEPTEKAYIATLERGQTYCYKDEFFTIGRPRVVDKELAAKLRELSAVVELDGREFDAMLFSVVYEVPTQEILNEGKNERPVREVLPPALRRPFNRVQSR